MWNESGFLHPVNHIGYIKVIGERGPVGAGVGGGGGGVGY